MSSYIHWIRQHVGHQKILMVYASACVRDATGRLLWQRRADFGWWGLPGGALELDESLPQCAAREVYEETGLAVEPTRLIGVYSSPDFDVTYPNGDQVQQVTACFACRLRADVNLPHGGQTHDDETLDLAWHDIAAPPPTAPWYRAMVDDLAEGHQTISFDRGSPGHSRAKVPFFRQVRRHIGPAPFVMPAAAAFVQDEAGHVLLQQRGDTGEWGVPGGGMELGERADQTAIHEVREETGLIVEPLRLIDVYSDDGFWYTYPHGDQVKVVSMFFQCRIAGGQLQADGDESLQVRFFAPDALPPLSERHARRIRDGLALGKSAP